MVHLSEYCAAIKRNEKGLYVLIWKELQKYIVKWSVEWYIYVCVCIYIYIADSVPDHHSKVNSYINWKSHAFFWFPSAYKS